MLLGFLSASTASAQAPQRGNTLSAHLGMLDPGGILGVRYQRALGSHAYLAADVGLSVLAFTGPSVAPRLALAAGGYIGESGWLYIEGGISYGGQTHLWSGFTSLNNAFAVHLGAGYQKTTRSNIVFRIGGGLISNLTYGSCDEHYDGSIIECEESYSSLRPYLPMPFIRVSLGKTFGR